MKQIGFTKTKEWVFSCFRTAHFLHILMGSIFLSLMAQFSFPLPFTPVPITLQTFAIAILAFTLGPKKAPLAVVAYLVEATCGLPVLTGAHSNPLWMFGAKGGYLFAFVLSAFVTAKLIEKTPLSLTKIWIAFLLNETIILALGSLWLGFFVGKENAFLLGALPFIPGAILKISMASSLTRPIQWIEEKLNKHG